MNAPDARIVTGRIEIVRYLDEHGRDVVAVHTHDPGTGRRLGVVEALGLLGLAEWDVCERVADDEDDR